MTLKQFVKTVVTVTGSTALVAAGILISSPRLHAHDEDGPGDKSPRLHADDEDRSRDESSRRHDDDEDSRDQSRIELGLQIAPVHLTYDKHNRKLVGLGRYLVNAVSECNGCHSAGPATEYTAGHNPFFGQPEQINTDTYLAGGRDFGQIGPPIPANVSPHIVSRNLTPDKTGLPEGGATFAEFYETIRHGIDHDHLHPNCSATITTNCFPHGPGLPPFNGDLLQVMPWPAYRDWTDRDLWAIYEYLKAIPCTQTPSEALAGVHACF